MWKNKKWEKAIQLHKKRNSNFCRSPGGSEGIWDYLGLWPLCMEILLRALLNESSACFFLLLHNKYRILRFFNAKQCNRKHTSRRLAKRCLSAGRARPQSSERGKGRPETPELGHRRETAISLSPLSTNAIYWHWVISANDQRTEQPTDSKTNSDTYRLLAFASLE